MAATVLNSPRAVEMSLYVVRAFVRMREVLATRKELARKLEALENKTEALALKHDALATTTRAQFNEVIEALRALMTPPQPRKRPIGFITPDDKQETALPKKLVLIATGRFRERRSSGVDPKPPFTLPAPGAFEKNHRAGGRRKAVAALGRLE